MEHILGFEDRIVRVGGRSKSDLLKDNLIYELRKTETNRGVGRLYRKREEIGKRIDTLIMDMYEEPCVTVDFLAKHKLLRPRQLDSLRRLGEREDKRAKSAMAKLDSVGDDDWVVSSLPAVAPTKPGPNKNSKRGGNNNFNKKNGASPEWAQGNPNHLVEAAEKPINAIEIWLNDAIEYTNRQDAISAFAEEMKDQLLEQQKGLVYDDDPNEEDIIDEEEAQELTQNFRDGLDLQGNKSRFINIGASYKTASSNESSATDTFFGNSTAMFGQVVTNSNANKRKVINYNKSNPPSILSNSGNRKRNNNPSAKKMPIAQFDFFSDNTPSTMRVDPNDQSYEELQQDEEEQHEVLERWIKTDDVTLWPLTVRLKAHKRWAAMRNRSIEQEIQAIILQYNQVSVEIRKQNVLNDAKLCRANRVVGMTSTAAVSLL